MKIITVIGARPQFIKAAAVSRAIREYNRTSNHLVNEVIVHTGQHYDRNMSDIFFEELDIPHPQYHLGIGSSNHGQQTGEMLTAIEAVLLKEKPDCMLVYGDTNSTLAGALAASKLHIPIAHVEAGLRSYNRAMPEEINRVVTDHLSSILFCPTNHSVNNLEKEGITNQVYSVGDVMYDCMLYYMNKVGNDTVVLDGFNVKPGEYALATVHRAENTDNPQHLSEIFGSFNEIADEIPVLVALHPRTKKYLYQYGIEVSDKVSLLDPLSYLQMVTLEVNAKTILTDSGGVQKEAYFVGKPCITLRNETEWVETIEVGMNVLAGPSKEKILASFNDIHSGMDRTVREGIYGDGTASNKIVNLLCAFNHSERS